MIPSRALMNSALIELITQEAAAFTPANLRLLVNLIVVIAHADLEIDAAEQESIELALASSVGHALTPEEVTEHIASARKRISASGSVRFAEQVGVQLSEVKLARAGAHLAYAIAAISGGISDAEQTRLRALTQGAKLSADEVARIKAAVSV